jgi:hypothetical protein
LEGIDEGRGGSKEKYGPGKGKFPNNINKHHLLLKSSYFWAKVVLAYLFFG